MNVSDRQGSSVSIAPPSTATVLWEGHMAEDGGSTFGPKPCATLSVDSAGLHLRGTRGDFRIPRNAIVRLGWGKLYPWFFFAVRIHHNIPGYSRELQFKPTTTNTRSLLAELKALGFPVI